MWVRTVGKSGGQGEGGQNHFTTHYLVKMDNRNATRNAVLKCGMLPVYGSPNAENFQAICSKVDATRRKGAPEFWDATADFDTHLLSGRDPSDDQKQPDERRPKWRARFVPVPTNVMHDGQGRLFADTAGSLFDPPPDVPIWCDEITVFRYEASCDRSQHRSYLNAANTDNWNGAQQGTVLIQSIDAEEEYIQGSYWYAITYVLLYKPRITDTSINTYDTKGKSTGTDNLGGWYPDYILNAGPRSLDSQGRVVMNHDGNCNDGRPKLLDKNGQEIQRNSDGSYKTDPLYLKFATKKQMSFASLQLNPPPGWTVA